jgi:hypothetical protein
MNYISNKGLIMSAVASLIQNLELPTLSANMVAPREDYRQNDTDLFEGASVVDMGEQYDEGTIGTQDVGYLIGVVFARQRQRDAIMADDTLQFWYESLRRVATDARLAVNLTSGAPKEHVMNVLPGHTLTDPKRFPNYLIRQLVLAVWQRENNP